MHQEPHKFNHFSFEGSSRPDLGYPIQRQESGPVFLYFVDADFSSLEGFIQFAEDHGLDGFQYFDNQLKRELKNRKRAAAELKKRKPIKRNFLEDVWGRIGQDISEHQSALRELNDFQKGLHKSSSVKVNLNRFKGGFVYSPPRSLANAIQYVNEHVREKWKINTDSIDLFDNTSGEITVETVRRTVGNYHECDSIIARCYAEIISLIKDGRRIEKCDLCKKAFIATRSDARFCNRPFLSRQGEEEYRELLSQLRKRTRHESREDLAREERAFLDRHSCRKIGPQITFQTTLEKEEWAFLTEYKRLHSRKTYYKKTYGAESPEYQKASLEFEKLKRKKPKKKKGSRGKNG